MDCVLCRFWVEEDLLLVGFAVVDRILGDLETAFGGICWFGAGGLGEVPGDEAAELIVESAVALFFVTKSCAL
jgi:hypothetical protein